MARTVIDIDDNALALAAEALGTKTKVDTVNAALRDIAKRQARVEAVEGLIEAAAVFGAPGEREAAWRMNDSSECKD